MSMLFASLVAMISFPPNSGLRGKSSFSASVRKPVALFDAGENLEIVGDHFIG